MRHHPPPTTSSPLPTGSMTARTRSPWAWMALGVASLLAACSTPVPLPPAPAPPPLVEAPMAPPPPEAPKPTLVSMAATPLDYRQDGARHLYSQNGHRIYKGQMPPLMHAVGVLQVDIDNMGHVMRLNWMRAPSHAPDVIREIERTVQAAAPFPAPVRLGGVTYTDVWLWDKSGHFQLDTLTEGQRLR